ncbi:hypothetical protein [Azospirillum sp.]|uniref:hypothetical protein n=1 Tax=Azospirillum sp. TaxID=34012 RepID=UPI003D706F48
MQRLAMVGSAPARLCMAAAHAGASDEAVVILDQGLVSAGSFALTAALARLLPLDDFGLYTLVMALVWLFVDLQAATIGAPYVVNRCKLPRWKRSAFFGSAVMHQGGMAVLAMAVAAVAVALQGAGAGAVGLAAPCAVALLLFRDQMRRFFVVHGLLRRCLAFDAAVLALWTAGLAAGVALERFTLAWGFGAAALACAVPCALWLPSLGRVHARVPLALRHWRDNWKVARWMVLSGAMWSLATVAYPWTISAAQGPAGAGLWAAALGLSGLCNVPLAALQNHAAVRIAAVSPRSLAGEVAGRGLRLAVLAAGFTVMFAVAGERLVTLLYGASFTAAAPLAVALTLNLAIGSASFCVSRGLFALGRGGADCAVNAIPLAGFALAGAWATVGFGPAGAAVCFLASNVLAFAVRAAVLRAALREALPSKDEPA